MNATLPGKKSQTRKYWTNAPRTSSIFSVYSLLIFSLNSPSPFALPIVSPNTLFHSLSLIFLILLIRLPVFSPASLSSFSSLILFRHLCTSALSGFPSPNPSLHLGPPVARDLWMSDTKAPLRSEIMLLISKVMEQVYAESLGRQ